jgi:hypothetical protein
MRALRRVAARALLQRRSADLVLRATLVRSRVRLSLLGNGHLAAAKDSRGRSPEGGWVTPGSTRAALPSAGRARARAGAPAPPG